MKLYYIRKLFCQQKPIKSLRSYVVVWIVCVLIVHINITTSISAQSTNICEFNGIKNNKDYEEFRKELGTGYSQKVASDKNDINDNVFRSGNDKSFDPSNITIPHDYISGTELSNKNDYTDRYELKDNKIYVYTEKTIYEYNTEFKLLGTTPRYK